MIKVPTLLNQFTDNQLTLLSLWTFWDLSLHHSSLLIWKLGSYNIYVPLSILLMTDYCKRNSEMQFVLLIDEINSNENYSNIFPPYGFNFIGSNINGEIDIL